MKNSEDDVTSLERYVVKYNGELPGSYAIRVFVDDELCPQSPWLVTVLAVLCFFMFRSL